MGISLDDIEDTLRDFDAWRTTKANPAALDLSVTAYTKELAAVKNANDLAEIRGIFADSDSLESFEVVLKIEAVLDKDG